jgi:hypothetical protein
MKRMFDLKIVLDNQPGALAAMGEALGNAGVSIEGGGAFVVNGRGVAHFLFDDGQAARRALEAAGIQVVCVREVVVCRQIAEAGVNIEVQYSDHANQLILVVDDVEAARYVASEWSRTKPQT